MARQQSYRNHRRIFPLYHYALAILIVHVIVRAFVHAPAFATVIATPTRAATIEAMRAAWDLIVWTALACAILAARSMALMVQNRVIRLEMRMRLALVLPPELLTRVAEIPVRQLIALRFASDAELPVLVQRILDGELKKPDEVKRAVRDWQPDFLRA